DLSHHFAPTNWSNNRNTQSKGPGRNNNLVCKHCHMAGHTIDRCYELNGYPPGFKKKNYRDSNVSNNASSCPVKPDQSAGNTLPFTTDQINWLLALIGSKYDFGKLQPCIAGTFAFSNHVICFVSSRFFNYNINISTYSTYIGWIFNSYATQHMTLSTEHLFDVIDVS
ncbi:hypothetical protein Tco_1451967, partial [Tanacetum coccineum]